MNDITKLIRGNAPATTKASMPAVAPKKAEPVKSATEEKSKFYKRAKAKLNFVPSPDDLQKMIDKALKALSKGVYWDRGSIINLVL